MKFIKMIFLFSLACNFCLFSSDTVNKITIAIKPISMILKEHSEVSYQKILDPYEFNYVPFFNEKYKTTGIFNECFVVTIPQGRVQGFSGNILVENSFIQELLWAENIDSLKGLMLVPEDKILQISGKVVVLAQAACDSYCHFMHEVLGRLSLLEMQGIEYDYVYVPIFKPCMKEMLELWGVDLCKIITPLQNECCLQADTLIVPSLVLNSDIGFVNAGFRPHPQTSAYVKNKLLQGALQKNVDVSKFSKNVFISRSDAPQRRILNEDEVFERFKPYGFVRYELSKLSVAEQILLMNNAEIVVGEHGAGLTNILFCNQNTLVIELFQKLIDNSNWWIANIAQLNYVPVNCLDEDISWAADWKKDIQKYWNAWSAKTIILLNQIDEVIEKDIVRKN
jgi:hypothetical protein